MQDMRGRYDQGVSLRAAEKWDEAVAAFEQAGGYSDAAAQIQETYYQKAKSCYDSGNYAETYRVYKQIAGYSNVDSLLSTDDHLLAAAAREAKLAPYKTVGNIVTFGQYEQDNNTGPEDRIVRLPDRVTEKVTEKVSDRQRKILTLLLEDPGYKTTVLAEKLGVTRKRSA